ncbi:hypothetical protein PWT90_06372 [Aphanocladium album]|nr:hypothetical protein PWT90_06372 [Aphanocladium album]
MTTAILDHHVDQLHQSPFLTKRLPVTSVASLDGPAVAKQLIGDALSRRVEAVDHELCEPGDEDTFFVADLGDVYRQHLRWKKNLARVRPFYAVKCNPDPMVLRLLAALGTGFDCASKTEIDQVLAMGCSPDRIIYAQPCKTNSYVRYVKAAGVRQMTFDNTDELYKIAKHFPEAELYLRIITDDTSSACRLSMKFGAPMDTTDSLLGLAKELGLNVVGVSFHVGSGSADPMAYYHAVKDAHVVFQEAAKHGFHLRTLDVGGGFSGATFEVNAAVLSGALDEFFPATSNVEIIAEPGRYYVASAFTIACNVIARRTVDDPSTGVTSYMIYINDGVYGNFSNIMFDHQHPIAKVLRRNGETVYDTSLAGPVVDGIEYSVWGPTCDGIDRITESTKFSHLVDVGDWLYFEEMGAYTKCSATQFNGFSNAHEVFYVSSEPAAKALLGL